MKDRQKYHRTKLLQLPVAPGQLTPRMVSQKRTTILSKFCPIAPNELKPSHPTNIPDRSRFQDVPTERILDISQKLTSPDYN